MKVTMSLPLKAPVRLRQGLIEISKWSIPGLWSVIFFYVHKGGVVNYTTLMDQNLPPDQPFSLKWSVKQLSFLQHHIMLTGFRGLDVLPCSILVERSLSLPSLHLFQVWVNNSQLPGDHVIAGSFDTAMRVSFVIPLFIHHLSPFVVYDSSILD